MTLQILKVSLQNKTSFKEGMKEELAFYLKFGENVKPVNQKDSSKSSQKSLEEIIENGCENEENVSDEPQPVEQSEDS